jgi:hypothetical protein
MKREDIIIIGDYQFLGLTGIITIKEIKGTIFRVKYMKVSFDSLLMWLLHKLHIHREYKETIYWNPFKNVLSDTTKYSIIGSKTRGVHAKVWFEVDRKNNIYKDFSNKFIHDYNLPIPFPGTHLEKVTSKRLKSILDDILYQNK